MSPVRTVGVVVEYNPFHNGHAYHLEQAKLAAEADSVVAVMSGNWLQRGEPAMMNKWARAEAALHSGVDLVIELPVAFSTQPAEWFAYGAISALHATGVVDAVCFGSESGDLNSLSAIAEVLAEEPERFRHLLQEQLKQGLPYPAAYAEAAARYTGQPEARLLSEPNNSLGFHYLLALQRLGSRMNALTIQRVKAGYHETELRDESIASATAIRKLLLEAERLTTREHLDESTMSAIARYVPASTCRILAREWNAGRAPLRWEHYRLPLLHRLLISTPEQLAAYRDVTEGLEHRIKKSLTVLGGTDCEGAAVESLLEALKTKRYTRTRLQRVLSSILLELRKEELTPEVLRRGVPYLRVLGFTEKGRSLLQRMKTSAALPVVTDVGQEPHPLLLLDAAATSAYALGYRASASQDWLADYYKPPVRVVFGGSVSR